MDTLMTEHMNTHNWKDIPGMMPEVLDSPEGIAVPERFMMLDLNRTVFAWDDKIVSGSEEAFMEAIAHAQSNGISVGFNSDSPLPPLYRLGHTYGMKGPVMAENGTVYYDPASDKALKIAGIGDVDAITQQVQSALESDGYEVYPSITAPEFEEENSMPATDGSGIAFGSYRVATMTMFGLDTKSGIYVPNAEIAGKAADALESSQLLPDNTIVYRDLDPDVAYVAVHPIHQGEDTYRPNKALGIAHLLDINPDAKILKIGDDERDLRYGIGEGSMYTAMVANASPEYKNEADLVATKEYTEGVTELIYKGVDLLKNS